MADPYAAFEVSRNRSFNPDTGPSFSLTFAGTLAEMNAVAAHYEILGSGAPIGYGYKTRTAHTSAGVLLFVEIPDEILYTTRWGFDTGMNQVARLWTARVRQYVPSLAAQNLGTVVGLQNFLELSMKIQRAITLFRLSTQQQSLSAILLSVFGGPMPANEEAALTDIIHSFVRDGEYVHVKQPSLKRCRTVPVGLFDTRTRIAGEAYLYSLDGIYNLFGLTDDVYDQAVTAYDGLPADEPKSIWAWKEMQNDSDTLVGSGKVQENRNWVFGRWSTIDYPFVE
jgi:hypothetical protein